ncbi:MAG: post-transcriptional regulator [Alicyclobacillus sp.]|nr:post-transcriptional regulator [Alicyclobacillus sp.]
MREPAPDWHEFEQELRALCASKAEEFHLLGYERITGAEVWDCVMRQCKGGHVPLHELVAAILGLTIGRFMNFATISAWQEADEAWRV